jgi:hypothetical protein
MTDIFGKKSNNKIRIKKVIIKKKYISAIADIYPINTEKVNTNNILI